MAKRTISAPNVTLASDIFRCGFTSALAHPGVSSDDFDIVSTAAGQTVSQTGGNLVFTTGTAVNEQTMVRSKRQFVGSHTARWKTILSQRIAQNNFVVELADKIADNVAFTNPSSTSVIVTIPIGIFTADNIGQTISIGNILGVAGIPGDAVIASATHYPELGTTELGLTVSGWPGAGSGTCILYGWNCYRALYDGTTATNVKWECRRRGYNATFTAFTMTTTASPGHVAEWKTDGQTASFGDTSATMATTTAMSIRAFRMENLPDDDVTYNLWLYTYNGSTAPATTTTWTVGFASVEQVGNNKVQAIAPATASTSPLGTVSATNLSTNISQIGGQTVTTSGVNGVLAVGGNIAHSTAATSNPVPVGGRTITTLDTTLTNGDTCYQMFTSAGQLIQKPYGSAENDWQYAAAASGILNTTTAVTIKAAAAASIRNYITGINVFHESLTTATELAIRDGAAGTVIWRTKIQSGAAGRFDITFPTPLKGTAATLLEVVTLTASGAGAVYFNANGYTSF